MDDSIKKSKEIFVARVFSQKEGINYEETFASVARYTSIRTVISLASNMKWKLHQMDVKTTFLNSLIEEELYIKQPQGFETNDKKTSYQFHRSVPSVITPGNSSGLQLEDAW